MLEWIKQNRKKLFLPGLCCLLGVLLGISSIQIQEEGTNIKEDRTLQTFQPKKYQNLIAGEQDSNAWRPSFRNGENLKSSPLRKLLEMPRPKSS